jgi:hypothetical protein
MVVAGAPKALTGFRKHGLGFAQAASLGGHFSVRCRTSAIVAKLRFRMVGRPAAEFAPGAYAMLAAKILGKATPNICDCPCAVNACVF